MSRWIRVDATINQYISDHLGAEHPVLQALRERTAPMEGAGMQISHEQACFMSTLLRAIGARRTLEIGVFTGYSALMTALALPEDGRLIACDISEEWTRIAREYWQRAGVADKIDLRLAPAADTLQALLDAGEASSFDFAFIDADKTGYETYYELCLKLLRPGGVIALDNCLWGGRVADAGDQDEDTRAIRALNDRIAADSRVDASLIPVGDGVYLVSKR
ncbi:MAG: class I SAM-dependent methyltransferase [Pseudomonadales bacterium]|nr:class I SAM-dependent methyltransferase [Pseudomonadales bacterium]